MNHVFGGFLGRFRILRHVIEDVVFHEFTHQAVDRATGGGETVKNLGALSSGPQSVFIETGKWSPLISGCIARVTRRSDLSARKSLCFRLCDAGKETLGVELLSAFAARVHRKF